MSDDIGNNPSVPTRGGLEKKILSQEATWLNNIIQHWTQ